MKLAAKVLVFAIVLVATLAIARLSTSGSDKPDKPTPIQIGVMSAQQREHSKLYERYKTGRKLDEIPLSEFKQGVEPGVRIEPGTPVVSSEAAPESFEDFVRNLTCSSDAVISATIKDKASQLTENREFIFTDYTALVEEVYKNNEAAQIALSRTITITRPGGRVEVNNRVVGAVDAGFKDLKVGKRYLLFLKFVPKTGAYQSLRKGSFRIDGDNLVAMTEEFFPGGPGDERPFSYVVRNALSAECSKH
jgi:hypothetical protein